MYVDYKDNIILLDIWEVIPLTSDNYYFWESFRWYIRLYIDEKKWSNVDESTIISNIHIYKLLKAKHRLAKNKNRWTYNYF